MKNKLLQAITYFLLFSWQLFSQYKIFYNYYNPFYGAKSIAMGNAFCAVADDLSAIYWNPAGLGLIKKPFFYFSYRQDKQSASESEIVADGRKYSYDFSSRLNHLGFLSISMPVNIWDLNWGFAVTYYRYLPYGFKGFSKVSFTGWESENKYEEHFNGSEGIDVLAFTASCALSDHFSLGISIQQFFNTGYIKFYKLLNRYEIFKSYDEKVTGRTIAAGLLYSPWENVRLGITYRSSLKGEFNSIYTIWNENEKQEQFNKSENTLNTSIFLPSSLEAGIALKITSRLNLSAAYSQVLWSKGELGGYFDVSGKVQFPVKNDFKFKQCDVKNYRLGAEYKVEILSRQIFIRAGIFQDHQLYRGDDDQQVKFNGFSFGAGLKISPSITLDIAYLRQKSTWKEGSAFSGNQIDSKFISRNFFISFAYSFQNILRQ